MEDWAESAAGEGRGEGLTLKSERQTYSYTMLFRQASRERMRASVPSDSCGREARLERERGRTYRGEEVTLALNISHTAVSLPCALILSFLPSFLLSHRLAFENCCTAKIKKSFQW